MNRIIRIAVVVVFLAGVTFFAAADPLQKLIGYTGFLTELGTPVTGARDLTFKIYSAATGGTPLWTETHTGVVVTDGEFTVSLGETVPLDGSVDFHSNLQYWLGVTIGAGVELTPRKKLLFVPYAFKAEIETRTSDPASPVTGQIWLRTDL